MKRVLIDKDWLLANADKMSPEAMAKEIGCCTATILRAYTKYGIKRSRHAHLIKEDFFETWSSDMAYILGFTFADGSINRKLHHNKLVYQLKDVDKEVLEFIIGAIQPTRNLYFYTRHDKRSNVTCSTVMTDFSSSRLIDSLERLGCVPNKTYKDILPPNVPKKYLGDFIRGLFDGDGSISICIDRVKYHKVSCYICCNCKGFLQKLQEMIGFGYVYANGEETPRLMFSSRDDIRGLYNLMYRDNNAFRLSRKFNKFQEIFQLWQTATSSFST